MAAYNHLPLQRLEGELERRKHGFGQLHPRNPKQHGATIKTQVDTAINTFKSIPPVSGIDPSLILKISLAGNVDEDEWRKLNLTVLSVNGDQSVVLFANDKSLAEFRRKVDAYQGELPLGQQNPPYAGLIAQIENVSLLSPEDRIGPNLKISGFLKLQDFVDEDTYIIDCELHRPPTKDDCDLFIYRLKQTLGKHGGEILSTYTGCHILLVRCECSGAGIRSALSLIEVAEIDLPPQADVVTDDLSQIDIGNLSVGAPPAADAVTIGIIDSGVNFGHPLLAVTEAAALTLDPALSSADAAGHGTSVASIAAFGDIGARAQAGNFDAQFRIASVRVLDDKANFPKNSPVPDLMEKAIRSLHKDHNCRIINISLGDPNRIYEGGRPDTWSATLDTLAAELDVLIIVSAGNRTDLSITYGDGVIAAYPHFFFDANSRLSVPAAATNVLTVGALAHANGLEEDDIDLVGVQPICGLEEPAPFTRGGPGIRGMIKPDLVDFGGNAIWDGPTGKLLNGGQKTAAGIWAFSHKPVESLFTSRSGTSFAAPNLAYKAANLLSRFPNASANLLRSLLALSANVPSAVNGRFEDFTNEQLAMVCGHGVCNADHAMASDDSRVVFFAEDEIALDYFSVFEVPIPPEFQTTKGAREIRVSLAYDPPVRHTRADYVGLSMGWRLLRGMPSKGVFDKFRKWEKEEGDPPEFSDKLTCKTFPGPQLRERGTLQVGTYRGMQNISAYGDNYYVAVWCLRRWAPANIEKQRYAISVQLRHANVNTLYQTLSQPVKIQV